MIQEMRLMPSVMFVTICRAMMLTLQEECENSNEE